MRTAVALRVLFALKRDDGVAGQPVGALVANHVDRLGVCGQRLGRKHDHKRLGHAQQRAARVAGRRVPLGGGRRGPGAVGGRGREANGQCGGARAGQSGGTGGERRRARGRAGAVEAAEAGLRERRPLDIDRVQLVRGARRAARAAGVGPRRCAGAGARSGRGRGRGRAARGAGERGGRRAAGVPRGPWGRGAGQGAGSSQAAQISLNGASSPRRAQRRFPRSAASMRPRGFQKPQRSSLPSRPHGARAGPGSSLLRERCPRTSAGGPQTPS